MELGWLVRCELGDWPRFLACGERLPRTFPGLPGNWIFGERGGFLSFSRFAR